MRLTRALFAISDVCSVIAGALLLSGALASPFLTAVYARMEHTDIGLGGLAIATASFFSAGIGLILICQHRAVGLLFASAPTLVMLMHGRYFQALVFEAVLLAICGTPLLLAFLESRRKGLEAIP